MTRMLRSTDLHGFFCSFLSQILLNKYFKKINHIFKNLCKSVLRSIRVIRVQFSRNIKSRFLLREPTFS